MKLPSILLLSTVLVAGGGGAPEINGPLPPGVRRGPSANGITEYRLANGLIVLLHPDNSLSSIGVNIRYGVGRYDERRGERGIAHLLEHVAFTGTPRHPNLRRELAEHGADASAATFAEDTEFSLSVPPTKTDLDWAIGVEADQMTGIPVTDSLLAIQRRIVYNEVGVRQATLDRRVRSVAFDIHPYSDVAQDADLSRIDASAVRAFQRLHYRPSNAVVAIDGPFHESAALATIAATFGVIQNRSSAQPAPLAEPAQAGERTVNVDGIETPLVVAAYHVPQLGSRDYPAVDLAVRALTGPGGRLEAAIVKAGMASRVLWTMPTTRYPDLAVIKINIGADSLVAAAVKRLRETIDGLADRPLEDSEIDAARQRVPADERSAEAASACQIAGDWRLCLMRRQRAMETSNDEVRQAVARYLIPRNRTLGTTVPHRVAPVAMETTDLTTVLSRFREDTTRRPNPGERFEPTVQNILARLVVSRTAAGLRVASLPKKTGDSTVAGRLTLDFGDARSLAGRAGAAEVLSQLLMLGTRTHPSGDLRGAFERLGASVTITSRPRPTRVVVDPFTDLTEVSSPYRGTGLDVSFRTTRQHLAQTLTLIAEVLREPTIDSIAFERLRRQILVFAAGRANGPNADYAFDGVVPPLGADDVERVKPIAERTKELERLTISDLRQFHAAFYGAESGALAIVGDHDPDSLATVAKNLFGSWKAGVHPAPQFLSSSGGIAMDSIIPAPAGRDDGRINFGTVILVGPDDPDYPAVVIANLIFGGSVDSRLFNRVREQEGLSYSVSSRLRPRIGDHKSIWRMGASYNVGNSDVVKKVMLEELQKATRSGFTAAEVTTAKKSYLSRSLQRRASDPVLAEQLTVWTIDDLAGFEKRLAATTAAEVNAAFRKYVRPHELTIVRVR